jgi:two-component system cell cycle sensor histidine kinase/response regulator CckA
VAGLCLAIGGLLPRRLSGSILSLASAAPHLEDGRPLQVPPTPVREVNQVAETMMRAVDRIQRDRRMADSLGGVARLAAQSPEPEKVARAVVEALPGLLEAKMAALYRLDQGSGAALFVAGVGAGVRWNIRLAPGSGTVGRAIAAVQPVVTRDLLADPEIRLEPEARANVMASPYRAALAVPLALRGTVIGALVVGAEAGRVFSPEEIALAERFAGEVAVAFEHARLYVAAQTSLVEMRRAYEELAQTKEQLTQAQKMEVIGRLAGGVAHDFNNLLTVILGRSELLRRELGSRPEWRRHVDLIHTTADRAAGLTRQLLAFSRKQVLQPKRLDLNAVVGGMAPMLSRLIGEDIELVIAARAHAGHIRADPSQLEQVILNLVVNARDAMPNGGRLTIQTAEVTLDDAFTDRHPGIRAGAYVVLTVSDTGVGMTAETRSRIFEPFFTTKEPGKGTGLGLASVYGIVKQSDGYISVDSEPGRGATFQIYLPRVDAADPGSAPPAPALPMRGTAETILLVEDDPEVRELVAEILGDYGYRVITASRPADAMRLGDGEERIDLLLTDVVMPEMSGRELAGQLTARHPELRVLYMSGYSDEVLASRGVIDPGIRLLMKPFTAEALTRQVRETLDALPV